MRSIDEIKAEIAEAKKKREMNLPYPNDPVQMDATILCLQDALRKAIQGDTDIDRLESICTAERDGRCVVLPIKPNAEFFYINNGVVCSAVLATYEIGHLAIFFWGVGIMKRFTALIFESGYSDIGKTVFLTSESAEAALAQEGEGQ